MTDEEKKEIAAITYESQLKANEDSVEQQKNEAMKRFVLIDIYDRKMAELREQQKKQKPVEEPKQFKEYFAEGYQETLPEALKIAFAKDKKTTKVLLIHALQKEFENKKTDEIAPLLILEGEFDKVFFDSMKAYFSWPVMARYQHYMEVLKDPEGAKARKTREDRRKSNNLEYRDTPKLNTEKSMELYGLVTRIKAILKSIDN